MPVAEGFGWRVESQPVRVPGGRRERATRRHAGMGKDLLSLAVLSDADMRQHLFLKDLPGVQDALVA
jgi:hypothetical protein